jgi:DNA (cytosine-5)-methyltransferase 1
VPQDCLFIEDIQRDYFDEMLDFFDIKTSDNWIENLEKKIFNWSKQNAPNIKVFSIFSGAGGLDIGFRDLGFNITGHLEIEQDFCKTLELNKNFFNNAEVINKDICEFKPNKKNTCDFIIGGPPCQTFSAAGRRAAGVKGIEDSRGVLFQEYVRLLKTFKPKGFLFENVYGITGAQNGKAWEQIKKEFLSAGYSLFFRILNTADYGVPQFRERMIIIGVREGSFKFPKPTHGPDSSSLRQYYSAKEAVKNVEFEKEYKQNKLKGRHGYLLDAIPPGLNYSFYTEKMGHPNPIFSWRSKFSDYLYKADPDKPVRTIKAQAGQYTGPFHWNNRTFCVNEFKRLQTFPDNYILYGNKQTALRQIGNSVPPQFARMLAMSVLEQIFKVNLPFKMEYLNENDKLTFRSRRQNLNREYKETANASIMNIKSEKCKLEGEKFRILLRENMQTVISESNEINSYLVEVKNNKNELNIVLKNGCKTNDYFELLIEPIEKNGWILDYDHIRIKAFSTDERTFSIAWKTLDYLLKSKKIKDDIVQLSGYYQYVPMIKAALNFSNNRKFCSKMWNIFLLMLQKQPIKNIITYNEFAEIFSINKSKVMEYAKKLKEFGYEIRNSNTNSQIQNNCILIPYFFPTLTHLSVQLRKEL